MRRALPTLLLLLTATALLGLAVYGTCRREMTRLRAALAEGSTLIATRRGVVEVAVQGEGTPVLLLHGAGGGYDQALLLARMFGPPGHSWIAVSRFGYLRSHLPADASTKAQAEALLDILDAKGIDRTAVLAMSGGVPPALQLAALAPDRVTGLALLSSAPFTPLTAASQDLPMPAWVYQMLFSSDLPVWAILHVAPGLLDPAFDVTPALHARLSPEDAATVAALVHGFLPVTDRLPGLANESAAIDPEASYPLDRITAPILIVHARDDGINPFLSRSTWPSPCPRRGSCPCRTAATCSLATRPKSLGPWPKSSARDRSDRIYLPAGRQILKTRADQLAQHAFVHRRQAPDVEAGLGHPMRPQPFQDGTKGTAARQQVHRQLRLSRRKSGGQAFARMAALIAIRIPPEPHHRRPPEPRLPARRFCKDRQQPRRLLPPRRLYSLKPGLPIQGRTLRLCFLRHHTLPVFDASLSHPGVAFLPLPLSANPATPYLPAMTDPAPDSIAPSLAFLEQLAHEAVSTLPAPFREPATHIRIRVEDFPTDEVLEELGIDDAFDLTGLYDGIPLTEKSTGDPMIRPDVVWLFRRPILDEWAERGNVSIQELVTHVVVHEIAHHFGWSDDDIAAIDPWWE